MTHSKGSIERGLSHRRPRYVNLLLVFGALFVSVLMAEVILRIGGFTYFNPYILDRDVGFSLRPGAEGWWKKEGLTYVRINSHGLRDREHSITKPANTLRIAILGDSYAEALQVPMEKAFWSVMERQVQGCPQVAGTKVEILNFGVSGFSTARELILLQNRVWQYSPDVIVLLFTTGNDVRDNSRTLNKYASLSLYFVFRDGKLILDDTFLAARNRSLKFRFHSYLVTLP
ncbi:MAG: SGNH/GDSL hydrolase family protein [Pyrinomonadaceae bacterium]